MGAKFELVKIIVSGLSIFLMMGFSLFFYFKTSKIFILGVIIGFVLFYFLNKYIKKLDNEGVFY